MDMGSAAASSEANPYLSFLPAEVTPDLDGWRVRLEQVAASRVQRGASTFYQEIEPPAALFLNDAPALAEPLPPVALDDLLLVRGQVLDQTVELGDFGSGGLDLGGSIPTAVELNALGVRGGPRYSGDGFVGNGAHGSAGTGSGDFDVFSIAGLAGQQLSVLAATPDPGSTLDVFLAVANSTGLVIAFEDSIIVGGFFVSSDAAITLRLPLDDDYFVIVGGSSEDSGFLPQDLFDAGSGPGVGTEGTYRLHLSLDSAAASSRDLFALDLEAGDVLAATLREGADHRIAFLDDTGELLVGSRFDLSALYPASSPLPAGGDASVAHVAAQAGRYLLAVEPTGPFVPELYGVELGIFRADSGSMTDGSKQRRGDTIPQGLFLDFDGAVVDRAIFFGSVLPPELVELSALSAFLDRWSLPGDAESMVIDAVLATVEQELSEMVRALGGNGDFEATGLLGEFDIEIRNSRDHAAQLGDARIVVGGSIEELNIGTIGIAEAIDPGNFERAKTAVVLLDLLSEEAMNANSLNGVELGLGVDLIDLLGVALGRIAAHEAGHLFGNFHTERDIGPVSIMDSGGRLELLLGLGDDGVFGTGDDGPVSLLTDEYSRREPFQGVEETLEVVSFGLPFGTGESLRVAPGQISFGAVSPGGVAMQAIQVVNDGGSTVTVDGASTTAPLFSVNSPKVSLDPGEGLELMVSFNPLATGAFAADLLIAVEGALPLSVPLTGAGGVAAIAVPEIGDPAVPIALPSIVYGPLTRTSRVVDVINAGAAPLDLVWTVRGTQADRFTVGIERTRGASQPAVRVAPGESVALRFVFDPNGAIGEASAILTLADALGGASAMVFTLRGRSDGPDVSVRPRPYVFGALRADGASGQRAFRVRNEGTLPLHVSGATLRAGTPPQFELTPPPLPRTLEPQAEVRVQVVFRPDDAIRYEGVLDVSSTDPEEPLAVVEMLGFGLLPMLEISPAEIVVDAVPVGGEIVQTLRLDNVGGATLRGSFVLIGGGGEWSVEPAPGTLTMPPGSNLELEVTYRNLGAVTSISTAILRFETDDRDQPVQEIPLRGRSVVEIPGADTFTSSLLVVLLMWVAVGRVQRL